MERIKKFSQNHTILFSLMITLFTIILLSIDFDGSSYNGIDMLIMHLILAVITYILINKLGLATKLGLGKKGLPKGILLGIPLVLLGILSSILTNSDIDINAIKFNGWGTLILFTLNMFMVGVTEEFVFRGLVLNHLLSNEESTINGKRKAVIISAVVFGLIHLLAIVIAPPLTALLQCINAIAGGLLFGVIYLYCKNIWSVIIVHALSDWFALFLQECFVGTTSVIATQMTIQQSIFVLIVGTIVPLFLSIILLQRIKND